MPTVVIEHNLTVAGAPGIGLEPGRAELDSQFERLEGVVAGVGLCATMRKEHRWGPSARIRVVITAYRGTSPAVRHTRNGTGRHPFGARRIGAHVGSAATVRVPLSLLLPALAVILALGSLTVGLRTVEADSAPSDRHCVGRPPRPSPPTTSCARPIGSVNVRLRRSTMPVCAWVDAPVVVSDPNGRR